MEPDQPSQPASPLEKFILKLTASMNGYTTLARDLGKKQKSIDSKLDALMLLVKDSRAFEAVLAERLQGLTAAVGDIRDVRSGIVSIREKIVEVGADVQVASERLRDHTPVYGVPLPTKAEIEAESTIDQRGIRIGWKTILSAAKHGVLWLVTGTGLGAGLYHLIRMFSHG